MGKSTDKWIKKIWDMYIVESYSTLRKKEILSFLTRWINLGDIVLSKISQAQNDKYYNITSLICGI
jgi:hypothetical protein